MRLRTAALFAVVIAALASPALAEAPNAATLARLQAHGVTGALTVVHPKGFPTVTLVSEFVPDAGPFFTGALIGKDWVVDKSNGWLGISSVAMRRFGWTHLSRAGREALALRWVRDARPEGQTTQTVPTDPHAADAARRHPTVRSQGGSVIVTAWITRTSESIGGPRTFYPTAATRFVFRPDGTVLTPPG